jgi:hypothetical protein
MADVEQGNMFPAEPAETVRDNDYKASDEPKSRLERAFERVDEVLRMGRVEAKGIQPVPLEDRKNTRYWNIFTVWCSMNTNILG